MNSCCCRTHSDRTDPMACLPSFPRLQRTQCCRPYLEGRRGSCCMSNERRWGQMNGGMIQVLAKMVNQSAGRVCQFLHQLTLQLFARILYPLMSGWNTLKIPFTLPDTCELYYGIFDECGNIRSPIPTRTLLILITMMQYFLNLPKPGGVCKRRDKCPGCLGSTEDSLKNIHNPGYCRNVMPFCGPRIPSSEPSPGKVIWAGLRRLGYDKYGNNLESMPSDESIPYGYAPHGCPCQGRKSQTSTLSRPPVSRPYAHLSGPLAWHSACEEELRSPMLAPDCRQRSPVERMSPGEVQRYYITHISDLYTAVVQNRHSRQLLGESKPLKQRVIPCQERRRSAGGFMMMPQPYFNGMPWSWLHRDPRKMMRFPNGGEQGLPLTPYRPQPIREEYQEFRNSYENTISNDRVDLVRENRLLPVEYSHRNKVLQAVEPFKPQKRLSIDNIPWELRPKEPENLPRNIHRYPREISGSEKFKMPYEDKMLVQVKQVRQIRSPLDYLKALKERNQLKVVQSPWSISKPLLPIQRERTYTLSKGDISSTQLERKTYTLPKYDISSTQLERSKPLERASQHNNQNNSLETVKPNFDRKLWIIKTCLRRIVSAQKSNANMEQQRQKIKTNFDRSNKSSSTKIRQPLTKSVNDVPQSLWRNAEGTTEKPNYPDPEEYRKETTKEHSRKKRHARKIAGESLFFITPAQVITSKPDVKRSNEFQVRSGHALHKKKSLLDQRTIERLMTLDKRVRFRIPTPQSFGRLVPTDTEKLNINVRQRSKSTDRSIAQYKYKPESGDQTKPLPNLKTKFLQENVNLKITERKTHYQPVIAKREPRKCKSPDQLSRFSNVFLTEKPVILSTKSLPRTSKSLEIKSRNLSRVELLRRKTTELDIPRRSTRQKKSRSSIY